MKLTDILRTYNVRFETEGKHCRPGWVQLNCPFCQGELYMGYNISHRYFNCWRCGPRKLLHVLMTLTGEPISTLQKLVGDIDDYYKPIEIIGKLDLPKDIVDLKRVHRRYLEGRGYDVEQLEKLWKIRAIALSAELSWRIFIPFYFRSEVVSWTTRSLVDHGSRYISAARSQEALNHKHLLYGEDFCRHAIVVCEGPLDVWKIGPGAVATCGTGFSKPQLQRMSKYLVRAVCFDNEPEAQKRAKQLCDYLEIFQGETYNVVLDGKDPGSSSKQEIEHIRKEFLS